MHQQQKKSTLCGWGTVRMDMRKRPVVLNKRVSTYSTSGTLVCNLYSIQKLKSPKNPRSIQISTLWAGLTNTNDMRIDNTRPHWHYGLTHGRARNKRYLNIDSDIMNPEKITNPSKWPCGHQILGAKRYCVHRHSYKLHCTVLKPKGWHRFHKLSI